MQEINKKFTSGEWVVVQEIENVGKYWVKALRVENNKAYCLLYEQLPDLQNANSRRAIFERDGNNWISRSRDNCTDSILVLHGAPDTNDIETLSDFDLQTKGRVLSVLIDLGVTPTREITYKKFDLSSIGFECKWEALCIVPDVNDGINHEYILTLVYDDFDKRLAWISPEDLERIDNPNIDDVKDPSLEESETELSNKQSLKMRIFRKGSKNYIIADELTFNQDERYLVVTFNKTEWVTSIDIMHRGDLDAIVEHVDTVECDIADKSLQDLYENLTFECNGEIGSLQLTRRGHLLFIADSLDESTVTVIDNKKFSRLKIV